jgi:hypothetical protein
LMISSFKHQCTIPLMKDLWSLSRLGHILG